MSYLVQATKNKTVVTFECETPKEVREKLHFIKIDKLRYNRKWDKVKVYALNEDVTELFKDYL